MKFLMNQEEFEVLIGRAEPEDKSLPLPPVTVVYFTATWCGPCRSVRTAELESELPNVNWLKCDVDQNDYTPGYCNVSGIPTFLVIRNKTILGKFTATKTEAIIANIRTLLESETK
jgi:thioredoxin 1